VDLVQLLLETTLNNRKPFERENGTNVDYGLVDELRRLIKDFAVWLIKSHYENKLYSLRKHQKRNQGHWGESWPPLKVNRPSDAEDDVAENHGYKGSLKLDEITEHLKEVRKSIHELWELVLLSIEPLKWHFEHFTDELYPFLLCESIRKSIKERSKKHFRNGAQNCNSQTPKDISMHLGFVIIGIEGIKELVCHYLSYKDSHHRKSNSR